VQNYQDLLSLLSLPFFLRALRSRVECVIVCGCGCVGVSQSVSERVMERKRERQRLRERESERDKGGWEGWQGREKSTKHTHTPIVTHTHTFC